MKPLVLILDNNHAFRESLHDELLRMGLYAFIADAGSLLLVTLQGVKPDALLISADLADEFAFSQVSRLCHDARAGSLPIIMYSSSTPLPYKTRSLGVGTGDFSTRLFSVEGLAARIHGLLLRHDGNNGNSEVVEIGGLKVDMRGYSVAYEDKVIDMSRTSFSVLSLLIRHPDRVFTRDQILDAVWGESAYVSDRSVDVVMTRLRQNLGKEARNMIKTVRGIGYKLSPSKPTQNVFSSSGAYRRKIDNTAYAL